MSAAADPWAELGAPPATAAPDAATQPAADPWAELGAPTSTEAGLAKAGTSGLTRGTAGIAALPGAALSGTEQAAQWLASKLPWQPTEEQKAKAAANPPGFGGLTLGSTVAPAVKEASAEAAQKVLAGGRAAGAATGGYFDPTYQPQTEPERYAAATGEALPNLAFGGGGGLLRGVVAPAVGSVAGGDVLKGLGVPEQYARPGGALLGGLAAHTVLPSVTPELGAAAETLGTQLPTAATGGPIQRAAGWLAQKIPIAGAPLTAMAQRAGRQATTSVGGALEEAGATTPAAAGQAFKDAYTDWNEGTLMPSNKAAYDAVSAATGNAASPLTNTGQAVGQILNRRAQYGSGSSAAVDDVANALAMPGGLTFDAMKDLRSMIGAKTKASVTPVGTDAAEYSHLYDTLTQDMEAAARSSANPNALPLWQKAQDSYKSGLDRQNAVARIIGAQGNASGEDVINRIQTMAAAAKSGADIASLNLARSTIGNPAWEKIAGSIAAKMGRTEGGDLDLATLQKNYGDLSDAGKQALFPTGTPLRQTLDAIGPVTQSLQGMGKGLSGAMHGAGGGVAAAAAMHFLDDPIMALKLGAPALPVSMLLSTPATASSLTKWLTAYRQATTAQALGKGAINAAAMLEGATRNLANTANSQLGADMDPDKVNGAVRSSWLKGSAAPQNAGQGAP